MGILDFIGVGQSAATPIEAIGNAIGKVYTTDGEKLSHQEILERISQNPQLWNFLLNQFNAQDSRFFNSGWRPYVGWICGTCVGLYYIPQFLIASILWTWICISQHHLAAYPINPDSLFQLLYLMLGFGAYRSVEKLFKARK